MDPLSILHELLSGNNPLLALALVANWMLNKENRQARMASQMLTDRVLVVVEQCTKTIEHNTQTSETVLRTIERLEERMPCILKEHDGVLK